MNEHFFPDPETLRLEGEIKKTPNLYALQELLPEIQDFNSSEKLHRLLITTELFTSIGTSLIRYLISLADTLSENEYASYEAVAGFFFLTSFFILIGHSAYFVMNRPEKLKVLRDELRTFNVRIIGNYLSATEQLKIVEKIIKDYNLPTSS